MFIKFSNVPAKAVKSQIYDDTDLFILLLHQNQVAGLKVQVTMESPNKDRAILDTAQAGSGCDTVENYFGVGKGIVIKHLK